MLFGCFSCCRLLIPWKCNNENHGDEIQGEHRDSGCVNSLTSSCVQNSSENQLAIVSAIKKGAYICQGPSYRDEFRGGERIESYPAKSDAHLEII